jgi:hypothetical protein
MRATKWVAGGAAALLLLLMPLWFVWPKGVSRVAGVVGITIEDPQYSKIDQAYRAMTDKQGDPWSQLNATPEERQKLTQEMGEIVTKYQEELNKLSPEEQKAYNASREQERMETAMQTQDKFMDSILDLPEAQKIAAVDKLLDQIVVAMNQPGVAAARQAATKAAPQKFGQDDSGKSQVNKQTLKMLDMSSAGTRAKGAELQQIMVRRIKERGIDLPLN